MTKYYPPRNTGGDGGAAPATPATPEIRGTVYADTSDMTTPTQAGGTVGAASFGHQSTASGSMSLAAGRASGATQGYTTALGGNSAATGVNSTAVGFSAHAEGNNSIAIGHSALAQGTNAIAIGSGASNGADNVISLGNSSIDRLHVPGLGLDTYYATSGHSLGWSGTGGASGNGGFAWIAPPTVNGIRPDVGWSTIGTVGSGSANDEGLVTFADIAYLYLNNIFSSKYSCYKIIFSYENSVNATSNVRLVTGSSMDTTANYLVGKTYQDDNTGGFQKSSGESWVMTPTSSVRQFNGEITLINPHLATPTKGWHTATSFSSASSGAKMASQTGGLFHASASAFDGIAFFSSTGNMTGTARVVGIL